MDRRIAGNDDGPVRQSVRADRSDHDSAQRWLKDRSSRGKRVGGGPSGRGYDQSVSPVGAKIIVTDISFQVNNTAAGTFGDHGVVEDTELMGFPLLAVNPDLQGHPFFDLVVTLQRFGNNRFKLVHSDFGNESEPSQIHPKNRYVGPLH